MGERVDIIVTETGSKQAAANIDAIGAAADKASVSVDKAKSSNEALARTAAAARSPLEGLAGVTGTLSVRYGALAPAATAASQGIRQTAQAAQEAERQTNALSSAYNLLKGAIAGIGVYQLVSGYVTLADTFSSIISRLKLVTSGQRELVETEQQLFEMSNRTRSSFDSNANLYLKLAQQAGQLGIEQKSLIPTIETINQLIGLSGAKSAEATAGLLQFSQGLASNRFQGDELRSVLENLPALGSAIAKGLGVTTGELRTMGEQGKLSAKLILDAISKQAPEIAKQFASITPTIGGAFQVLKNNLLQLVGTWDQIMQSSGTIAQIILLVANNLGNLARAAGFAATAIIGFYTAMAIQAGWQAMSAGISAVIARLAAMQAFVVATGVEVTLFQRILFAFQAPIAALTSAFQRLWVVIAANPIGAILTLLAAAAAAVYFFGDSIKITSDGSINLWGAVMGTLRTLWQLLQQVGAWVATVFGPYWTALGVLVTNVWNAIVNGVKMVINFLALLFPSLDGLKTKLDGLGASWIANMKAASAASNETGLAAANLGEGFRGAADAGNALAGSNANVAATAKFSADGMTQLGRVVTDAIPPFTNLVRKQEEMNRLVERGKKAFDDNRRSLEALNEAAKDTTVTTRDAMGNIIKYTNEAENQTGRFFSGVQNGANSASGAVDGLASSFDNMANSAANASSSASNFGGGGGGGSSGSTGTIQTITYATQSQVRDSHKTMGGSAEQANAVIRAINDVDFFYGTGLGGSKVQALYKILSSLKPEVAKTWTQAYPYLNTYMAGEGLPTFRHGGQFMVGGNGGTDSQLVQFMASPDESVTVETPAQRRRRGNDDGGGGGKTVIVNMAVSTPDANSFNRSKQQTYLALKGKLAGV